MWTTERSPILRSEITAYQHLLYFAIVSLLVPTQELLISEETLCTPTNLSDQLGRSFKVLKLGHARNIKSCVNLCCNKKTCDLALFKRDRCYGIRCPHRDLCRRILNELRRTQREISKRSVPDAQDLFSDLSHHVRSHGFCRGRRVIPHHVFLDGGQGMTNFRRLSNHVMSMRKCNKRCCEKKECSLAFIIRDKCYGVMCPDDGDCNSSDEVRVPLHLEIALVHRRGIDAEINERELTSTKLNKKRKAHVHKPSVKFKSNLDHKSGHFKIRRGKHVRKGRHAKAPTIRYHHKPITRHVAGRTHNHFSRRHYHKNFKRKNPSRHREKLREKSRRERKRKDHKILDIGDVNEGRQSYDNGKNDHYRNDEEKEYKDEVEDRSHKSRQDSKKDVEKMTGDFKNDLRQDMELSDPVKRKKKKRIHHRTDHNEQKEMNENVDDLENEMKDAYVTYKQHKIFRNNNEKGNSEGNEMTQGNDDTKDINKNDERDKVNDDFVGDEELPNNNKINGDDNYQQKHLDLYSKENNRPSKQMMVKFRHMGESYKLSKKKYEAGDSDEVSDSGRHIENEDEEEKGDKSKSEDDEGNDESLQKKRDKELKEKNGGKTDKWENENTQEEAEYSHIGSIERKEHEKHKSESRRVKIAGVSGRHGHKLNAHDRGGDENRELKNNKKIRKHQNFDKASAKDGQEENSEIKERGKNESFDVDSEENVRYNKMEDDDENTIAAKKEKKSGKNEVDEDKEMNSENEMNLNGENEENNEKGRTDDNDEMENSGKENDLYKTAKNNARTKDKEFDDESEDGDEDNIMIRNTAKNRRKHLHKVQEKESQKRKDKGTEDKEVFENQYKESRTGRKKSKSVHKKHVSNNRENIERNGNHNKNLHKMKDDENQRRYRNDRPREKDEEKYNHVPKNEMYRGNKRKSDDSRKQRNDGDKEIAKQKDIFNEDKNIRNKDRNVDEIKHVGETDNRLKEHKDGKKGRHDDEVSDDTFRKENDEYLEHGEDKKDYSGTRIGDSSSHLNGKEYSSSRRRDGDIMRDIPRDHYTDKEGKYDRFSNEENNDLQQDMGNERGPSRVLDEKQKHSYSSGEEDRKYNSQGKQDSSDSRKDRKDYDDNWNNKNYRHGKEGDDNGDYIEDEIDHQHKKNYEDRFFGNHGEHIRYEEDKIHPDDNWNDKYRQDEKEEDSKRYKENQNDHQQQENDYQSHLGKNRDSYDHLSDQEDKKDHSYDHWNNKNSPGDQQEVNKQHYKENLSIYQHQGKDYRIHQGKKRDRYEHLRYSEGKGEHWHERNENEDHSRKEWIKDGHLHGKKDSGDQKHNFRDKMNHEHMQVPNQNHGHGQEDKNDQSDALGHREARLHDQKNEMGPRYGKMDKDSPSHEAQGKQDDTDVEDNEGHSHEPGNKHDDLYAKDKEYHENQKQYIKHFNNAEGDEENPKNHKSNKEQFKYGKESPKDDTGNEEDREQGVGNDGKHQNNDRGKENGRQRIGEGNNRGSLNENGLRRKEQHRKVKQGANGDGIEERRKQRIEKNTGNKGDLRSKLNVESTEDNRNEMNSRNRTNAEKDSENREKGKVVKNENHDESKDRDLKEDSGTDLNRNKNTKSSSEIIKTNRQENDVDRKQNIQEKTEHEWTDKNVRHSFKHNNEKLQISSSKLEGSDKFTHNENFTMNDNNANFPVHKKSLYHNLKDLDNTENEFAPRPKVPQGNLNNLHNFKDSNNDIMGMNLNYTAKHGKSSQSAEEQADVRHTDATKYFDQQTKDWRESSGENEVEDHEKYFNQMTRDWSTNQPKKEFGEYFHNLTSGWNLKNDTRLPDSEKYFNQRTKQWIGEKEIRNHSGSNQPAQNNQKVLVRNSTRPEKVLLTQNNKTKIHGLTEFGEVREINQTVTVVKDKNYEHEENRTFRISQNSDQKYLPQSGNNNTSVRKPNEDISPGQNKTKPNKIRTKVRFQNSSIGRKNRENDRSFNNIKILGNTTITPHSQQKVINTSKTRHKSNKWSEEKVKNEILKLIGEDSTKTDTSKANKVADIDSKKTGFQKTSTLFDHGRSNTTPTIPVKGSVTHLAGNRLPNRKTISRKLNPRLKSTHPLAAPYYQRKNGWRKSKSLRPPASGNKKYGKIPKKTIKIQSKQSLNGPIDSKNPIRPKLLKRINHLPVNILHEQKLIFSKMKNSKKETVVPQQRKVNRAQNRKSQIQQLSRRIFHGKSDETATEKNRNQNLFQNFWNQEQTSVNLTPYSPTVNSIASWNKPNDIFENGWKDNSYPWQQYYGDANIVVSTVAPTSSWNNMNWYLKGNEQRNNMNAYGKVEVQNPNGFVMTTPTPVHFNRQFPSGNDGNKNNIGDNYWKPEVGNLNWGRQDERNGMNPLSASSPRWNDVHILTKQNNVKSPQVGQKSTEQTAKLTTPTKGFEFNKFLEHVLNVSSFIPPQNNGSNVAKPKSKINNHPYQNKVSGSTTKPSMHQEDKPTFGFTKIVQKPVIPYRNTSSPKENQAKMLTTSRPNIVTTQSIESNSTSGDLNPFEINKIEPLQPEIKRNMTAPTKKENRPSITIPKGCFPGEIMSEMTLANGLGAGNYTKIGKTELMDTCISKCCRIKTCEVAIQMDNVCFAIKCHSKDTCKIKTTLGKSSHHKLCFISRRKKERQSMNEFDEGILGAQDVCPTDRAVGLNWKKTIAGSFDEIPCPKKAKGLAKRKCSLESKWLIPDFSGCVTSDYEELYNRAKRLVYGEDMSSLLQNLAVVTTRTIENSLIFGGDLKKTTEIITSIVQEQGVKLDADISHEDLKNFLVTCSNLLDDSNKQEWKNIQTKMSGSADILRYSQTFALLASSKLLESRLNVTYVTNNIMLQITHQVKGSNAMIIPDYTNPEIAMWDGEKDHMRLPDSVFSIGDTRIVSFSYKTLPELLPMAPSEHFRRSEANSKILGTIVQPLIQDKITPAITITLHHLKENRINPRCVSWDFNINPVHGGAWSTKGCWLEYSDKKHSVCRCNHFSNFAVLMDVADTEAMQVTSKDLHHFRQMAAMWICVPVLIVLIIGALYTTFTWSRSPQITPRTLNEKSCLLRSSVTTQEIRYDYSSPSRHLYSENSPKFKELEWQNEFRIQNKHVCRSSDNTELDSGIESNDLDDSSIRCDLSVSQDSLSVEESAGDELDTRKVELERKSTDIDDSGQTTLIDTGQRSNVNGLGLINLRRLKVERRVFAPNLRRCTGNNDLSTNKDV